MYKRDKLIASISKGKHILQKRVACKKCTSQYRYEECHSKQGSEVYVNCCSYKLYHKSCGEQLTKEVVTSCGFYPNLYCVLNWWYVYCSSKPSWLLRENIFILGIIPGPKEPKLTMNSYLAPVVSDLLDLWNGVEMKPFAKIRCAMVGVVCDLPAGRKVCGFLGHSANLGCSRCYT